jgi:hypothetical protein
MDTAAQQWAAALQQSVWRKALNSRREKNEALIAKGRCVGVCIRLACNL